MGIKPVVVFAALGLCFIMLYTVEGQIAHMPFVSVVLLMIAALIFVITGRFAFSNYLAMALVCFLTLSSVAKYRSKGFDLHVYDLVFTGTDREAIKFLMSEFGSLILPLLALIFIGVGVLVLLWRVEPRSSWGLMKRSSPLLVMAFLLPFTYPLKDSEPRYFHYLGGFNASSFFISFLDLTQQFSNNTAVARIANAGQTEAFKGKLQCDNGVSRPDIYIVLSESATNFRNYPQLNFEANLEGLFQSEDGRMRNLRVETFGGGTWVSNLSLMTGLASTDFGWRAPYLTTELEGKIRESLAISLLRCGYRTAALLPMKHSFVNEGPFLESIGFETILDYNAIGASAYAHRDSFYFGAADAFIKKHQEEDGRPLFLEIQTMFGHSPYDEKRLPKRVFQASPFSGDPKLNEHVRRVLIAQTDFRAFLERRKRQQPDRPFVLLEFGDHQALATKAVADELSGGNSLINLNSVAYKTYYSVHSHASAISMQPFEWDTLDIGFLGVSLLQSVGIPLSPMFVDLARLRDLCHGKFHDCEDRKAVDFHLQRRIKSGLLTLP